MKKCLIGLMLAVSIAVTFSSVTSYAHTRDVKPKITEELLDFSSIEDKFSVTDEDFRLTDIEEQMLIYNQEYHHYITLNYDDINVEPGTIIKEGYYNDINKPICHYTISVPSFTENGEASDALDDYGVIETFFYETDAMTDGMESAVAELLIFNKKLLKEGHPIRIDPENGLLGMYCSTGIPVLHVKNWSETLKTDDILALNSYKSNMQFGYYGDDYWEQIPLIRYPSFTDHSFNFSQTDMLSLVKTAEKYHILDKKTVSELYSKGERTSFDIYKLFNDPKEGALSGIYELKDATDVNDYICFIYPNNKTVIAVKEDEILIGTSARNFITEELVDVDVDKLYVGSFYKDETKDPELVGIANYKHITKNTLTKLLDLLFDSEVDVFEIDIRTLDLE